MLQGTSGLQLTKDAVAIERLPVLFTEGRYSEAIVQAEALLASLANRTNPESSFQLAANVHYGFSLLRTGRFQAAAAQAERITATAGASDDVARYQAKLLEAQISLFSGLTREAETKLRALLASSAGKPGATVLETVRRNLAHNLLQQGRNSEALVLLRDIEAKQRALYTDADKQNPNLAVTRILIGVALLRQGDTEAARSVLLLSFEAMQATRGSRHFGTLLAESYLAALATTTGTSAASVSANANAAALALRIERELGWQYGATDLAARLRRPDNQPMSTLPAVL